MSDQPATEDPPAPRVKPRGPRRARYWIAAVLCVVAVAVLLFGALGSNIEYYRSVSEAVKDKGDDTFRMAGQVVAGSEVDTADGGVKFRLTDGPTTVTVVHHGEEPGLFADARREHKGIPVVTQGRWSKDRAVFNSDLIMIKHGSDYEPPKITTTTSPK